MELVVSIRLLDCIVEGVVKVFVAVVGGGGEILEVRMGSLETE